MKVFLCIISLWEQVSSASWNFLCKLRCIVPLVTTLHQGGCRKCIYDLLMCIMKSLSYEVGVALSLSPFALGYLSLWLPRCLSGKEFTCQAGDMGSVPGSGRSLGKRNSNPLQHSCLGNPMDRGTWKSAVYGVTKSQKQLSDSTTTTIMSQKV